MRWFVARAAVLLVCGLVGCSSGGGTGVDASGSGGSSHAGSGGGGGAATGGAAGAPGQAGNGAPGGASGGGQSGSQGGAGTTGVGGAAQGGTGGAPQPDACNVEYDCPPGETCSVTGGGYFACVPSGSGKAGDACVVDPSLVTCGDQEICASITSTSCYQICDNDHPCPSGKTCMAFSTQVNEFLSLCV